MWVVEQCRMSSTDKKKKKWFPAVSCVCQSIRLLPTQLPLTFLFLFFFFVSWVSTCSNSSGAFLPCALGCLTHFLPATWWITIISHIAGNRKKTFPGGASAAALSDRRFRPRRVGRRALKALRWGGFESCEEQSHKKSWTLRRNEPLVAENAAGLQRRHAITRSACILLDQPGPTCAFFP